MFSLVSFSCRCWTHMVRKGKPFWLHYVVVFIIAVLNSYRHMVRKGTCRSGSTMLCTYKQSYVPFPLYELNSMHMYCFRKLKFVKFKSLVNIHTAFVNTLCKTKAKQSLNCFGSCRSSFLISVVAIFQLSVVLSWKIIWIQGSTMHCIYKFRKILFTHR